MGGVPAQRGLKVSGVEYVEAIAAVHAAGRKMGTFLTSYDVILSTTLAGPPPKLGYFDQNGDVQTFAERVTEYLSIGDAAAAGRDRGRRAVPAISLVGLARRGSLAEERLGPRRACFRRATPSP
jgi:hypothetical protein